MPRKMSSINSDKSHSRPLPVTPVSGGEEALLRAPLPLIYIYIYIYMYIYIYIERERERKKERESYIYIYMESQV